MTTITVPINLTAELPAPTAGSNGASAYEIALRNGFIGTEQEWLLSLKGINGSNGTNGTNGLSAYQIAVQNGFAGTEAQWLLSLKGADGSGGVVVSTPGGRLTLVSGQPEMPQTSDYTSTSLYYAPFESDQIPLFDGTAWGSYNFTSGPLDTVGLSMAGGAAWAANTKRDVFVALVGGVPVLCTGPAWPNDTLAARGLVRRNGLWVNAASMSCDTAAASAVTVAANQATWVGSINIGATAGSLQALFALGQNRRCDVWNVYHQREICLGVGCPPVAPDPYPSWFPANQIPTWQAFNNDANNSGYYFTGLPQKVECEYLQRGFIDSLNKGICGALITICKESLTNPCATIGSLSSDYPNMASSFSLKAHFNDRNSVGSHRVFMAGANANNTTGILFWGLVSVSGRPPEESHVMWIRYQG